MFRSCKSSVPARSSFDKFKARPGPKCWYPSPPEARKVQKMEGSSPPEARKTEARHITTPNYLPGYQPGHLPIYAPNYQPGYPSGYLMLPNLFLAHSSSPCTQILA